MTKLEQAARQALGALEVATTPLAKDRQEVLRAITTLREALSGAQALSAAPAVPTSVKGAMWFTKKPVTIQAIQWTGENLREVITFTDGPPDTRSHHAGMAWDAYRDLVARDGLKIYTLEGKMLASTGDWIIRGVKGELYPCKPDIFQETYAAASPTPPAEQQAAPKAAPVEQDDRKILAITTAYEHGVGKGHQAYNSGKEIANPYSPAYRCDLAWQYGYKEGKEQAQREAMAAPQPAPHLPERDASLPAERQGLFHKFVVGRVDGSDKPGGKHYGCTYFVLDVDHDPCARPALAAYAAACESTHPTLAADLRTKWGVVPAPQPAPAPLSESIAQVERALAIIGVVGAIDGHDVVRRESVLEIARRAALAAQGDKP